MSITDASCAAVISLMPPMARNQIGGLGVLSALRNNAFNAFPPRCLEEPVIRLSAAGKPLIIACAPEAIRHVLSTHVQDYRRPPAGRRVLGAIFGRGLAVSEGEDWRRQRQAVSPAFTPRMTPLLARQIMRCTAAACGGPSTPPRCPLSHCTKASVGRVINCLAASQLRIARLMLRFFGTYGDAIHADYLDSGQDCEERWCGHRDAAGGVSQECHTSAPPFGE
jgi:hypothetical protein